jgi:hypothetical protein
MAILRREIVLKGETVVISQANVRRVTAIKHRCDGVRVFAGEKGFLAACVGKKWQKSQIERAYSMRFLSQKWLERLMDIALIGFTLCLP